MKKKRLCCAFTMFVLAMNIFGEGWVISDSLTHPLGFGDLPKVAKARTLASAGSPALDAVGPDGLPLVLPGGSPQAVRDYIVAPHAWAGVHSINVGFTTYPQNHQVVAMKTTYGYQSYNEFLGDIAQGFRNSAYVFKTNFIGSLALTNRLYSYVPYNYFAGDSGTDVFPGVLFISDYVCTFGELIENPERAVQLALDTCSVDRPAVSEQMIISVPNLNAIHMAVQLQGGIATLDWSLSNPKVSILQNWNNPREWNVPGLLYLRGWMMSGTYIARVALTKNSGETVIYTQYGQRVVTPNLSLQDGKLIVLAPRGANVILESSADLVNWKRFGAFQNIGSSGTSTVSLPVDMSTKVMFFRGDSN